MRTRIIFALPVILFAMAVSAQTNTWRLAGNTLNGSEKLGSVNSADLRIFTNNLRRVTIKGSNGRIGVGTTTPENTLHIFKGSAGTITANADAPLIIESSTHNYMNLLAPDANETGVLFGKPQSNSSGGIIYSNPLNPNGLQFRTNGNITRMALTDIGDLGIGTTTPSRRFEVQGGDIRISRTMSGARFLEFVSTATDQNDARMEYSSAGSYLYFSASTNDFASFSDLARFDLTTAPTYILTVYGNTLASGGVWTNSDFQMKKDINDLNNAMNIIRLLRPKTFFYKMDEYKRMNLSEDKQYGFVAQELEKVLPELVQTSQQPVRVSAWGEREMEELSAVNYMQLIPILTRALQEQEQKINSQDQKIEALTKLVGQLVALAGLPTTFNNAIPRTPVNWIIEE